MRKLIVLVLASLALSSCGGTERTDPGAPTGPEAAGVHIRQIYDVSKGMYVEGAYSYVRVEDLSGKKLVERRLGDQRSIDEVTLVSTTTLNLDPGTYRLLSFQRPCEAICGGDSLDPPTDRCSQRITVEPGSPLAVTVSVAPAEGCTIEVA
jgi:hypothetical protein